MKNHRRTRGNGAQTKESGLEKFDVEKYSEKTKESEECEPAMLAEFAIMMTLFAGGVAGLVSRARAQDLLPKKIKPLELLLLGVATHKLTRIVSKERITGVLRAPFVHYKCSAGAGEVEEEPRGRGLQRAVGNLVSCPYCMGPWCASALGFGMLFAPRTTKFLASILSCVAISDFLNRAYAVTKEN